jgi:glycosyltransferase involved in cell wall biosynthesis
MQITSYSHPTYRPWDWNTPDTTGIGGSETAAIEMAGRLALRGNDVQVYAPVDFEGERADPRGARWTHSDQIDPTREGAWIINRCPEILDRFPVDHPQQKLFFLAEDTWYPGMNPERAEKLDHYICLCKSHAEYTIQTYPYLKGKIYIGSNGVKVSQIEQIEQEGIERNPRKMVFASSPDRGLMPLLKIFRRARQWISGLELHVFYGFQNMLKTWEILGSHPNHPTKKLYDTCIAEMQQPGVTWHDRTPQPELYRHWLSAGIWCHPSLFTETNCINSQDAMACGAIPVTIPIWAVGEFVRHGIFVYGDPYNDPLAQERFVGELHRLIREPGLQQQIRTEMIPYARKRFDWERTIDQLEGWFENLPEHSIVYLDYDPENRMVEMREKSRKCLENSLEGRKDYEMITITDGTCWANSVNRGLERARGRFIHFVSNDVMIEDPSWIEKLAIPSTVTSWSARTFVLTGAVELDMALFCIPREVRDTVGGIDERYSGYGFDDDAALRKIRRAGFETRVNPVKATHLHSQTFKAYYRAEEFQEMYDRNKAIFKAEHPELEPEGGWLR